MPAILAGVDLGALFVAFLLLILAAALWVIAKMVQGSLGHAPAIGPWISAHIVAWLYDARDAVMHAAAASWHAAASMFLWAERWITDTYDTLVFFAVRVLSTVDHIVTVQIPAEARQLESYAYQQVVKAESYAHLLFTTVAQYAQREVNYLRVSVDQSVSSLEYRIIRAESYALQLARQALSDAELYGNQLFADATAYVRSEIDTTVARIDSAISGVESMVTQAEAQAVQIGQNVLGNSRAYTDAVAQAIQSGIYTDLNQAADAAVAEVWPDAARDIAGLGRQLGADFPWLNDLLGGLAGAGTAGLAGALIRALAGTHAVTRLAEDCIVPNCRNLSGLGRDLAQLAGAGSELALFGWLAEAVADPAAWAKQTDSILKPVADTAVSGAKAVIWH